MNELTKQDIEDIEKEIKERIALRKALGEEVVTARSFGDLSENAEYHEARRTKGKNESRIRYLRNLLRFANIIDGNSAPGEVGFFDKVTLYFEDEDEEEIYIISTSIRIDARKRIISKDSPLGKAIFGKKVGDRVLVNTNEGVSYHVVIKHIEKANGNTDLGIPINGY